MSYNRVFQFDGEQITQALQFESSYYTRGIQSVSILDSTTDIFYSFTFGLGSTGSGRMSSYKKNSGSGQAITSGSFELSPGSSYRSYMFSPIQGDIDHANNKINLYVFISLYNNKFTFEHIEVSIADATFGNEISRSQIATLFSGSIQNWPTTFASVHDEPNSKLYCVTNNYTEPNSSYKNKLRLYTVDTSTTPWTFSTNPKIFTITNPGGFVGGALDIGISDRNGAVTDLGIAFSKSTEHKVHNSTSGWIFSYRPDNDTKTSDYEIVAASGRCGRIAFATLQNQAGDFTGEICAVITAAGGRRGNGTERGYSYTHFQAIGTTAAAKLEAYAKHGVTFGDTGQDGYTGDARALPIDAFCARIGDGVDYDKPNATAEQAIILIVTPDGVTEWWAGSSYVSAKDYVTWNATGLNQNQASYPYGGWPTAITQIHSGSYGAGMGGSHTAPFGYNGPQDYCSYTGVRAGTLISSTSAGGVFETTIWDNSWAGGSSDPNVTTIKNVVWNYLAATPDSTPPSFTFSTLTHGSYVKTTAFSYNLDEALASGNITWTRTSGSDDPNSPHVANLAGAELSAGTYSQELTNKPTLVDGAKYTITFNGEDAAGNVSTPVSITNITYDTTAPVFTVSRPATNTTIRNTRVIYTLSESLTSGSITWLDTNTNTSQVVTLTGNELNVGEFTGQLTNPPTLQEDTIYNISFDSTDLAGNQATTLTITNVKYRTKKGGDAAAAATEASSLGFDAAKQAKITDAINADRTYDPNSGKTYKQAMKDSMGEAIGEIADASFDPRTASAAEKSSMALILRETLNKVFDDNPDQGSTFTLSFESLSSVVDLDDLGVTDPTNTEVTCCEAGSTIPDASEPALTPDDYIYSPISNGDDLTINVILGTVTYTIYIQKLSDTYTVEVDADDGNGSTSFDLLGNDQEGDTAVIRNADGFVLLTCIWGSVAASTSDSSFTISSDDITVTNTAANSDITIGFTADAGLPVMDVGDVVAVGGTLSNFSGDASTGNYSVTFTHTVGSGGAASVTVNQGAISSNNGLNFPNETVTLQWTYSPGGSASGDPIMVPIYGHPFQLPVDSGSYLLFDNQDVGQRLIINTKLHILPEDERLKVQEYCDKVWGRPQHLLSYMKYVSVFWDGEWNSYDMDTLQLCETPSNSSIDNLKLSPKEALETSMGNRVISWYNEKHDTESAELSWMTNKHGKVILNLEKYADLEIRNGVRLQGSNITKQNAFGALVACAAAKNLRVKKPLCIPKIQNDYRHDLALSNTGVEYNGKVTIYKMLTKASKGDRIFPGKNLVK